MTGKMLSIVLMLIYPYDAECSFASSWLPRDRESISRADADAPPGFEVFGVAPTVCQSRFVAFCIVLLMVCSNPDRKPLLQASSISDLKLAH